jgi:glycine/D-amino acid oxidase-like deaminating enzyme
MRQFNILSFPYCVRVVSVATRPIPKDGLSAIGRHPALKDYYVTVTHSGVTMGAFIGETVRDELLHGQSVQELAPTCDGVGGRLASGQDKTRPLQIF